MLKDSLFCHCTFTKGTYHRQFGKSVRFPIFRLKVEILSSFKQNFLTPHIHITESKFGKYFIPWKEFTRSAW